MLKSLRKHGFITYKLYWSIILQHDTIKNKLPMDGYQQWQQESKNMRKSCYLVPSYVKPLNTKLCGQCFSKGELCNVYVMTIMEVCKGTRGQMHM